MTDAQRINKWRRGNVISSDRGSTTILEKSFADRELERGVRRASRFTHHLEYSSELYAIFWECTSRSIEKLKHQSEEAGKDQPLQQQGEVQASGKTSKRCIQEIFSDQLVVRHRRVSRPFDLVPTRYRLRIYVLKPCRMLIEVEALHSQTVRRSRFGSRTTDRRREIAHYTPPQEARYFYSFSMA